MSAEALPALSRIARGATESRTLWALVQSPNGIPASDLRDLFGSFVVEQLEAKELIYLYDGAIFGITNKGRVRLDPPVCVAVVADAPPADTRHHMCHACGGRVRLAGAPSTIIDGQTARFHARCWDRRVPK